MSVCVVIDGLVCVLIGGVTGTVLGISRGNRNGIVRLIGESVAGSGLDCWSTPAASAPLPVWALAVGTAGVMMLFAIKNTLVHVATALVGASRRFGKRRSADGLFEQDARHVVHRRGSQQARMRGAGATEGTAMGSSSLS